MQQDLFNFDNEQDLDSLVKSIEYHNKLYWEKGEPEISDEEYDALLRKLEKIAPDHPLLSQVHAPSVAGKGKVKHETPMLSLDKAYSFEELMKWAEKYSRSDSEEFLLQPKYDGISANFDGEILATRGDGTEGENVSDKIPLVELEAPGYKGPLDRPARGEIVIRNDDFEKIYSKITRKDGRKYKNSRNAVAGIMGLKNIDNMVEQGAKLTFISYYMVCDKVILGNIKDYWTDFVIKVENLPYPTDGIVVKLSDGEYRESLGSTAHHPRGEIAFKFSGARKRTKLLDVNWSFGKNCLTPVARLEPVDIGGITITQATLHNVQNIIDRDIRIGDDVLVERAGDVIPYILDSYPGEDRESCLISECPSCGTELRRRGPELICPNRDCPETKLRRLLAAVRSIGIERLGEPNIRKMMDNLGVKNLKDIFDLSLEEILSLEGFKEKSAQNLYSEIQNAKDSTEVQILTSLNINGIGKNIAAEILSRYSLDELRKLDRDELAGIDGIGPERAEAIFRELREKSGELDELVSTLNVSSGSGAASPGSEGICFTGKMPEKRSHYEDIARQRGYTPVDSVSSTLSVLVAADPGGNSSKLKKARKQDIKIISLQDWLDSG